MRGSFADGMFDNSPTATLCDYVLERFLGKRCGGIKDVVGNGLGKCLGHDYLGFAGFFME